MLGRTWVDAIVGDYGVSAYCINLGDDVTSCLFDESW